MSDWWVVVRVLKPSLEGRWSALADWKVDLTIKIRCFWAKVIELRV